MSNIEDPSGSTTANLVLNLKQYEDEDHTEASLELSPQISDAQDVGERGPGDGREENTDGTDDEDNPSSSANSSTITTGATEHHGSDTEECNNDVAQASIAHMCFLPWGARKERDPQRSNANVETELRPGEYVMRTLFAEFTVIAEKKIETVMQEPLERSLSKTLQRGEDSTFDQLLSAFGNVGEHCLPSLLRTLFAWYARQGIAEWGSTDHKYKQDPNKKSSDSWTIGLERELMCERRDLAVEFLFCLVLIEVLKQLPVHPGHDDLIKYIEDVTFKHFKYREFVQNNPNGANINIVADLYAEVAGVLAQSRFQCIRRHFMTELKELRAKEASTQTTQSITSLLMGMKFFRVKMVPIEEFEASFQFMQECAQYFLEVRDKDIKHALAGLFVEILVPVAAAVKNEVNVPCLKNFVEMLYSVTQDMATKNKHRLAIFPLVTCLLCVSQKTFFLSNWHYFLAMCLQHLKNRDPKMSRVALESLYRLLWVYMIRIKCESNSATHSRLASIVNSLFPKGSKAVVPRDTPLNIFVKIIQFIAQERLDFAMREIVFDLLSVGRQFKFIMTPERMSIGLRAFLVVADSLQQKEGDPPMPRTVGPMPSGNTLRVKKTFLNKMLTEETAKNIGLSSYYALVRKSFNDILKALDSQFGKPLMMTNTQNLNKEPDEMITGERKPKIDLFRTCVAAVPRLIPDGMSGQELVELFSRLTVHMDEELRALSFQSLQNLVIDFPEWRHDVVFGFIQFLVKEVPDTNSQLVDNGLRMLLQVLTAWKNALGSNTAGSATKRDPGAGELQHLHLHQRGDHNDVLRMAEGFAITMLCSCRQAPRRVAVAILREVKALSNLLLKDNNINEPVIDVMDRCCVAVLDAVVARLPAGERAAISSATGIDLQWLADRNSSVWTGGFHDDSRVKSSSVQHLVGPEDVWPLVLVGFLQKDHVFSACPQAIAHVWPIVYTRINNLYTIVDPVPVSENRASLLRSATQMRKPVNERDMYLNLWRNYIVVACCVVPAITKSPVIRCVSPDISLGSSPDSGTLTEKTCDRTPQISAQCLYKLLVPLLRCDVPDIRDTVTLAMGNINHLALSDLMEELLPYIRESIDRNKENMRRRKRRDILRLHLVKLFEMCAEHRRFALCDTVLDPDNGNLQKHYLEYMDGARIYLEGETDKDNFIFNIKMSFCNFLRKLIGSFSLEQRQTLMPRSLRKSLFYLFCSWSGTFGSPFASKMTDSSTQHPTDLEFCALHASTTVLCCGPCFDSSIVADEGRIYQWLQYLFNAVDENIKSLAEETIILLLEFNPDSGAVLDWVVDQCYVASPSVADSCFNALATIFSAREYPCDHYTAVLTVTLLNTGCPRGNVQETALQLLQILDKRFFGAVSPIDDLGVESTYPDSSTLDVLLSASYSRSQMYLSKQLSILHPEFTMPIFSEITYRSQTACASVRQLLFQCMLPWLYNMELVDPSSHCNNGDGPYYDDLHSTPVVRREGWGSAEATEMVLNNLFYITVKFGDENSKEIEELWAALSTCWPNNLRVIIRYLFIITGVAPNEILAHAKRVTVYVGRAKPDRLVEELMTEMGTVETLNCVIERTETPPFFRLTSMRKTSSHGEGVIGTGTTNLAEPTSERGGTIHTKRHSGEQDMSKDKYSPQTSKDKGSTCGSLRSTTSVSSAASSVIYTDSHSTQPGLLKNTLSAPAGYGHMYPTQEEQDDNSQGNESVSDSLGVLRKHGPKIEEDHFEPHPLPMPEYGGYFAPLTEYLPDSSQPITAFHRCNLAVMLICDVIVAGIDVESQNVDWSIHVPLMLHVITLGLDHSKPLVHEHCKILLVHLLTVVANHRDHLGVARVLLNNKTTSLGYGLLPHNVFVHSRDFIEEPPQEGHLEEFQSTSDPAQKHGQSSTPMPPSPISEMVVGEEPTLVTPTIVTSDENDNADTVSSSSMAATEIRTTENLQYNIKALTDYIIASESNPLWNYEDITSKQFTIKSAEQLSNFVRHIVAIFSESVPQTHIEERMAQIALHLALSCSSRHYAGRSLQVFRCLRVSMSSRMLSELLGRLVETVAEQGEDMQGYVTELMLTLEAAVEALHSDFRPIEFVRELFKSTPNLNNKERRGPCNYSILNHYYQSSYCPPPRPTVPLVGHFRSTSTTGACSRAQPDMRGRSGTDVDARLRGQYGANICKSRSAHSLKQLADQSSADDKMTVLAQLFWIAVSILESEYEYEFLLAMRLLNKVLSHLSLDRPDCRDKVDKLQQQLKWKDFPGVHALLLKGCTASGTYEPTIALLTRFTQLSDLHVVDPIQNRAFAINVIALLPYMLLHYEDATELCIQAAENIAQECGERGKKLENLATVMTLYSRRNFSKESFQWTKCVVKYLHDSYEELTPTLMAFLVEILEKGPTTIQNPILNILHGMLHYIDMNAVPAQLINGDLMNAVSKHIEGVHWKESLRILKLAVTKSSALVVPPIHPPASFWEQHQFTDIEAQLRKELPGRTMEFTYDITQTPVIGRRFLTQGAFNVPSTNRSLLTNDVFGTKSNNSTSKQQNVKEPVSPQRSLSISAADGTRMASWKRPWLSQARVRERLVNLLSTCGQRVGLPKSPSVIFSQNSELERQSSMASSTEEVSVAPAESANDRAADEMTYSEKQFAVFKDFDFLEYELESQGDESIDNFNLWGVRRRSPGNADDPLSHLEDPSSETNPLQDKSSKTGTDWWEEEGPASLIDESSSIQTDHTSTALSLPLQAQLPQESVTPPKLTLDTQAARRATTPLSMSDHSESSEGDLGDTTPCNASPGIGSLLFHPIRQASDLEDTWRGHLISIMSPGSIICVPHSTCGLFNSMYMDCVGKFNDLVAESSHYFGSGTMGVVPFLRQMEVATGASTIPYAFLDTQHLVRASALHKFRSTFVALHEHFDTFMDKQENAFVCLDSIKSTLKLHAMGESILDVSPDDQQVDLYRSLYKLHFQLFLLYDTYTSFLSSVLHCPEGAQLSDHSIEVGVLQMKLFAAVEELNATPPSSPSRQNITPTTERPLPEGEEGETDSIVDDSEASIEGESTLGAVALEISEDTHSPTSFASHMSSSPQFLPMTQAQVHHQILQFVADQEWLVVLQFVRRHRMLWSNDSLSNFLDDVTIILNTYCSYLSDKKSGMIAVCSTDIPIEEVSRQLTEASMTALSALRGMEEAASQNRGSSEFSLRKTEC